MLKLGTFNIFHCQNYQKFLDTGRVVIEPDAVAEQIKEHGIDVIGLNEVRQQERSGLTDQAKEIAEHLGYNFIFAKAIDLPDSYGGGEYGNAVISRYPIVSAQTYLIPIDGLDPAAGYLEQRVLLKTEILVGERTLTFISCHFGLTPGEVDRAYEVLRRVLAATDGAVVFAGDLNIAPDSPVIAKISALLDNADERLSALSDTFIGVYNGGKHPRKIDYVFTRGLRVAEAHIPEKTVSDHRMYYVSADIL